MCDKLLRNPLNGAARGWARRQAASRASRRLLRSSRSQVDQLENQLKLADSVC